MKFSRSDFPLKTQETGSRTETKTNQFFGFWPGIWKSFVLPLFGLTFCNRLSTNRVFTNRISKCTKDERQDRACFWFACICTLQVAMRLLGAEERVCQNAIKTQYEDYVASNREIQCLYVCGLPGEIPARGKDLRTRRDFNIVSDIQ